MIYTIFNMHRLIENDLKRVRFFFYIVAEIFHTEELIAYWMWSEFELAKKKWKNNKFGLAYCLQIQTVKI